MTPQPLPKPSQVLREALADPGQHWAYATWGVLLKSGEREVECRCQGGMLNQRARQVLQPSEAEGVTQFVCRAYGIPFSVFSDAVKANDNIDEEDGAYQFGEMDSERLYRLDRIRNKYLTRVIVVYEEAGL